MSKNVTQICRTLNFPELSGKNVTAAIIDSGIVLAANRRFSVSEGIWFYKDNYAFVRSDTSVKDTIGHGTACAGIIAQKAPDTALFPVKIFNDRLETDLDLFEAAIQWCLDRSIRVLNVSLGTTDGAGKDRLEGICEFAYENGMIMVAAENNRHQKSYPATFPFVLGVTAGKIRKKYGYYFRADQPVEIVARGDNQRLHWGDPRFVFLGGTSFAAPHITAIICLILEKFPQADFEMVKEILACNALPGEPVLVDAHRLYTVDRLIKQRRPSEDPSLKRFQLGEQLNRIKRAVLYPFSKEMHALVRYRDLLPFAITAIADVPGRMTIGKDAGVLLGMADTGLIVGSDLTELLAGADAVILGYLDELSGIRGRNLLHECCAKAVDMGKDIFSFLPLSGKEYREIRKTAAEKRLKVLSPFITFNDYQTIVETAGDPTGITVPVVGIFGTGPSQGKLTTQLCLRRWLKAVGYNIAQIGTEHHGALFGFDFTLPIGYGRDQSVQIPTDMYIPLLQAVIRILDAKKPDIVIAGAQSGVIPFDFSSLSDCYTLPTLAFLFGTQPDAYILVINSIDSEDYVQDTINVLGGLGKGELIAIVFSDMKKGVRSGFNHTVMVSERLTQAEIENTVMRIEERFQVPVTEVISQKGQLKLFNAVINYFADDQAFAPGQSQI